MHETSPIFNITALTFGLLFLAALVSMLTKRVKLPLTVALVVLGLGVSVLAQRPELWPEPLAPLVEFLRGIRLTPDLILFIFVPTLIFESAYNLDVRQLLRNLGPIATLAVPGLIISTLIVGLLLHWLINFDLLEAMLFGVLISATDPVAVIVISRRSELPNGSSRSLKARASSATPVPLCCLASCSNWSGVAAARPVPRSS